MIGKKYQKPNNQYSLKNQMINKNSEPKVNVLQFDINNDKSNLNNNRSNNYNSKKYVPKKNIRHSSQNHIPNKINDYSYNYQNNFMIMNSSNNNNRNDIEFQNNYPNRNPQRNKLNPIIQKNNPRYHKAKSKDPIRSKKMTNAQSSQLKSNINNNNMYEDEYENPDDVVNELPKNQKLSKQEENMINTIKQVSSNRVKYRHTHQMLQEIGRIMNDPIVGFLVQKETEKNSPSKQLSTKLSDKLLEEHKKKLAETEKEKNRIAENENEEEQYYEMLQNKIKEEIKKKGDFDFNKLSDKDRKILAQRKLYNKMGKKVYEDKDENYLAEKKYVQDKVCDDIKEEINREIKKENFFDEVERYNKEEDDYYNLGKKQIITEKKMEEIEKKEKPSARDILERVLNHIEYKNEQLINTGNNAENMIQRQLNNGSGKKNKGRK